MPSIAANAAWLTWLAVANAPDVLGPKGALWGQTKRLNLAHGDFVHGSDLKQVLRHFMGNI